MISLLMAREEHGTFMDGENQTKARISPCQNLHCFTDFGIRLLIAQVAKSLATGQD